MSDSKIYRQKALDSFHSRDEFQQGVRLLTPKSWIYLAFFALLFFIGFVWLVFGKIATQIQGQGIIFAKNAEIINVMSPKEGGYVKQLLVTPGQAVKKGQQVASLANPNIASEIKELENFIAEKTANLNQLKQTAKTEIDIRIKKIDESIIFTQQAITSSQEKEATLNELLKVNEAAYKKGILSRLELTSVQVAYFDAKDQILKNQKTLVELNQSKNDYIESWNSKIRDLQEKLDQSEYNLDKLTKDLELLQSVLSPVDGVIANTFVKQGDFLTEKQTLANVITYSNQLEVIGFFSDDVGKKIEIGMNAIVFPKHINKLEYGGIYGKITYVSELPIPASSLGTILENQKLVDKFELKGPVFRVKVALNESTKTATGYEWSTSYGPKEKLTIGSAADIGITTKKESPLAILLHLTKSSTYWVVSKHDQ